MTTGLFSCTIFRYVFFCSLEEEIVKAVFLSGLQGSGKGMQGALLAKRGFKHLVASDALGFMQTEDDGFRNEVSAYVSGGILVPDDITLKALKGYLQAKTSPADNVILDGYMRTAPQADGMISYLQDMGYDIFVILLVLDEKTASERALLRGRKDDTPEKLKVRFQGYYDHIGSVLATVVKYGHSIHVVNTTGAPEGIHERIYALINK